MINRVGWAFVAALLVLVHGRAWAGFCAKKSGAVVFRSACKRKETAIDLSQEPDLRGPMGAQGVPGPPGPLVDTLPSGRTLVGAYTVTGTAGASGFAQADITFSPPLATAPTGHFVQKSTSPPAECPGTIDAPAAMPGHLCIYEALRTNINVDGFSDPLTGMTGSVVRPFGVLVGARAQSTGDFLSAGSWAVTAP